MSIWKRNWTILKILGFPIKINPTWFLLLLLIVFSLSSRHGLFSQWLGDEHVHPAMMWALGVIGALGLFISLLIHELTHSVVARRTGMPVKGITLFIFGGVSEMEDEPVTAGGEFFMAAVGPLSSLFLAAFFIMTWALCNFVFNAPSVVNVLLLYLAFLNFALAAFNSLPAFPLDGGRVLRSFLWGLTNNLIKATRIASSVGAGFGLLMIIGGIFSLFHGGGISGLWLMFLGFFLRQAAISSLDNVLMRTTLGDEQVGRFMSSPPICVGEDVPIDLFVDEYVLPYHFSVFPVTDEDGKLKGLVKSLQPGKIDKQLWSSTRVKDIMETELSEDEIAPDTPALEALKKLSGQEGLRLIVVENQRPVGMLSLRDLLDFINIKADLDKQT